MMMIRLSFLSGQGGQRFPVQVKIKNPSLKASVVVKRVVIVVAIKGEQNSTTHAADIIESTSFLKLQSVLTLYSHFVGCWTCSTCCGDPSTCCRTSSDGAHMAGCVYIGNSIVCICRCSYVTVNASMLFTEDYCTLNPMKTRRKVFCCSVQLSLKGPFLLTIDMNKLDSILCTPSWRLRLSSNRKIKYYKCECR